MLYKIHKHDDKNKQQHYSHGNYQQNIAHMLNVDF